MYEKLFELQEEVFRAIASRKRLEIIQLLHQGELSVNKVSDMLGIRQSNISQHLSELRRMRVVSARRKGAKVFYKLTDERISEACKLIKLFLQEQHKLEPTLVELAQDEESIFPSVWDAVCGMRISLHHVGGSVKYNDKVYYFCGAGCENKFNVAPKKYTSQAP